MTQAYARLLRTDNLFHCLLLSFVPRTFTTFPYSKIGLLFHTSDFDLERLGLVTPITPSVFVTLMSCLA